MTKEELLQFSEGKINSYTQQILNATDTGDDSTLGESSVYMALRRVLKNEERRF